MSFFHLGRMISGSKSGYTNANPDNKVVFNANLCTKTLGRFWYGDLDLTVDRDTLLALRSSMMEDIYVLREMDARFEYANSPKFEDAVEVITLTDIQT